MIIHGDCLIELKKLKDNSVDAVVTDPPYELGFMGKAWDNTGIAYRKDLWLEVLRVLKPGGYLLSSGGSRTYHRMACAIEDAGFEIRDQIMWVYGSGFPKSLNIGKAIDKDNGKHRNLRKFARWFDDICKIRNLSNKQIDDFLGLKSNGATASHYRCVGGEQPRFPRLDLYYKLQKWLCFGSQWDEVIKEAEREVIGKGKGVISNGEGRYSWHREGTRGEGNAEFDLTIPATDNAKLWEGYGTALKPAHEPIVLARKPLSEKTVAENCLKWGVGGLNIDGCRVGTDIIKNNQDQKAFQKWKEIDGRAHIDKINPSPTFSQGRFPSNFIHDGSQEVVELFPNTKTGKAIRHNKGVSGAGWKSIGYENTKEDFGYNDGGGSAARFFYCAKASKRERDMGCEGLDSKTPRAYRTTANGTSDTPSKGMERFQGLPCKNNHPTVKPLALMEYLVKLVSREGQTILDPFMGSGTTGIACKELNREFIGIEMNAEYVEIAKRRIIFKKSPEKTLF